jgi:riboflavin synthase
MQKELHCFTAKSKITDLNKLDNNLFYYNTTSDGIKIFSSPQSKIIKNKNSTEFYITIPKEFLKYILPKGSITIDGVSLTVNEIFDNSFRLTIIPHTIKNTIFNRYKIGTRVNIETDMFARYIYNLFKKEDKLSWDQIDSMMFRY